MKIYLIYISSILLFWTEASFCQTMYINEVMSSNNDFLLDEDGDASDWIELYNSSATPLNLLGYYISDKEDQLNRWAFPAEIIPGGGHLVLFASGKDRSIAGSELHTNFSVKDEGEALYLSFRNRIVHQMPATALETNSSFGLLPDGGVGLEVFEQPTPGMPNVGNVISDDLIFSESGGIYENPFFLTLSCSDTALQIRYTTDGSSPGSGSDLYENPLFLDSMLWSTRRIDTMMVSPPDYYHPPDVFIPRAVVLRAALFSAIGKVPGSEVTNTYFIKSSGTDHPGLPLISVCAEYYDLFNDSTGIMVPGIYWDPLNPDWTGNYHQSGEAWERKINFEYYNPDNSGLNQPAGVRIHGGSTRKFPQKGLRIYARAEYGDPEFNIKMFDNKEIYEFSRLVLKPFYASWTGAGIEDVVCHSLAGSLNIDTIASKPVILYLNGEYWGIYYLQERIDDHYLADNFNIDIDQVDLIANWWGLVDEGNDGAFLELYNYIENHTFTDSAAYQYIDEHIDIENFIDYQIFEIYNANFDWPSNNMKCWKPRMDNTKWRWIFYDGDAALQTTGFDGFEQALSTGDEFWPTNAHSTLFLRRFLENPVFFRQFTTRLEQVLNSVLSEEQTTGHLTDNIDLIENEIPRQIIRYSFPVNFPQWTANTGNMYYFLSKRSCVLQYFFFDRFNEEISIPDCLNSIEDHENLVVYPNPNHGVFSIVYTAKKNSMAEVMLVNHLGRQVVVKRNQLQPGQNLIQLRTSDLPDGIYLVYINDGEKTRSKKLLILND
ncbi:MAG: CotH kinase family protein [Bacteroidota bacterium]